LVPELSAVIRPPVDAEVFVTVMFVEYADADALPAPSLNDPLEMVMVAVPPTEPEAVNVTV